MLKHLEDDLELIFNKTSILWTDFKNKTVFITGGTGFFGIWLIMSFLHINKKLNLNSKLIILTRDKSKFLNKHDWLIESESLSFLEGDILNFKFIENPIDYIIHAATEASVKLNLEQPLTMFETIVNGTKRVLEFAKMKKVKSFLLTSSGAVYGKQPSDIENIPETYLGAPLLSDSSSVYGEGKRMAEVLSSVYYKHYNLPIKIARCYAFIGPYLPLDTHFAAGNFIKNLLDNEDIVINGDGTPHRSYMYSADLMIWLWTILFNGENNKAYNVGSAESISIRQLAEAITKLDLTNKIKVIVIKTITGELPLRYVPNIDFAKNELNLDVFTDLNTSLQKTIAFNKIHSSIYEK